MLNIEKAVQTIEEYLSREEEGALIVDTADHTVDWSMDGNAISHGEYVVIETYGTAEGCECEESYNSDCEQCQERRNYLLDQVERLLK